MFLCLTRHRHKVQARKELHKMAEPSVQQQQQRPRKRPAAGSHRRPRRRHVAGESKKQAPAVAAVPACAVCAAQQPKYKCPKCRAPYCGIACCRTHKEKGCAAATPTATTSTTTNQNKYGGEVNASWKQTLDSLDPSAWEEAFEDLDDDWKLTTAMKDALHKSSWLQDELQDQGLRQLLVKVVAASQNTTLSGGSRRIQTEQEQLLQQLIESNSAFGAFVDKVMVIAGVLERQSKDVDSNLEEWLSTTKPPLNVGLKPLSRRQPIFKPITELLQDDNSQEGSHKEGNCSSSSSEEESSEDAHSSSSSSSDDSSDED